MADVSVALQVIENRILLINLNYWPQRLLTLDLEKVARAEGQVDGEPIAMAGTYKKYRP